MPVCSNVHGSSVFTWAQYLAYRYWNCLSRDTAWVGYTSVHQLLFIPEWNKLPQKGIGTPLLKRVKTSQVIPLGARGSLVMCCLET